MWLAIIDLSCSVARIRMPAITFHLNLSDLRLAPDAEIVLLNSANLLRRLDSNWASICEKPFLVYVHVCFQQHTTG
jgi:hypothetical protein